VTVGQRKRERRGHRVELAGAARGLRRADEFSALALS